MSTPLTSYTRKLDASQAGTLRALLEQRGYGFRDVPYAQFAAEGRDVNAVMYESGKLVVQGRGTEEFVQFILEPEVLGRAELGYEEVLNPDMLLPRIGVDESGKGDLFGPLCVAGVYVNAAVVGAWKQAGIRDSKAVGSDRRIGELADVIRRTEGCVYSVVPMGNEAYNRLFAKLGSVNRMLAWGHARVIENLMGMSDRMHPAPVRAVIDQFAATENTVNRALMSSGRKLEIVQRHKAESDMAVAAASILARHEFVRRLGELGRHIGLKLPKGAGIEADRSLAEYVEREGVVGVQKIAKVHFRNLLKVKALR